MPDSPGRHRVVIVGAGFAGYNAARELYRLAGASTEITVINSTDYFLYLPLLPQVGVGLVEPRHICVSLLSRMPKIRFVLGTVTHVDVRQKVVTWSGPEGGSGQAGFDRLILTAGSVNNLLDPPAEPAGGQRLRGKTHKGGAYHLAPVGERLWRRHRRGGQLRVGPPVQGRRHTCSITRLLSRCPDIALSGSGRFRRGDRDRGAELATVVARLRARRRAS